MIDLVLFWGFADRQTERITIGHWCFYGHFATEKGPTPPTQPQLFKGHISINSGNILCHMSYFGKVQKK